MSEKMELPKCLTERPLVFGDREQINAIKALKKLGEEEAEAEELGQKIFIVKYEMSTDYEIEVWAKDEREAREKADDEYFSPEDWDVDFVSVTAKTV